MHAAGLAAASMGASSMSVQVFKKLLAHVSDEMMEQVDEDTRTDEEWSSRKW